MGVYIKGMEMPTSCMACLYSRTDIRNVDWCVLTEKDLPCDCPLVPVPPHGRLIDADALIKVFKTKAKNPFNQGTAPYSWAFAYECLADVVGDMPTILPAEEGE